jgi:hypothetical protein
VSLATANPKESDNRCDVITAPVELRYGLILRTYNALGSFSLSHHSTKVSGKSSAR